MLATISHPRQCKDLLRSMLDQLRRDGQIRLDTVGHAPDLCEPNANRSTIGSAHLYGL